MSTTAIKGPTKGWFNVNLLGISHFTSDFYCNVLPVMLPLLALKFGLSYSQCGALFMVFSVSTNFIQPPIGILADKYRVNYLMPLSIFTGAVFSCLIALCPNIYILILIVLLAGIFEAGFHPIAGGIMPHICPDNNEVLATSIFIAGGNIGFAIAPMLVAFYLETAGYDNLIYLSVPAIILTGIILMRRLHVDVKEKKNVEVPSIMSMIKNKPFSMFVLAIGLRSWCYCSLLVYIPLLLSAQGFSTVENASALMVLLLGTAAGGLATGGMSAKYGLKTLIQTTFVVTLVAESYFLYDPSLGIASYIALFITGAGMYGSTPVAIVWARRMLSDNAAALATSLMLGFAFGIGYIVSVFTGFLGDIIGLQLGLTFTIIPAIIAAIIIIAILKEPKAKLQTLN